MIAPADKQVCNYAVLRFLPYPETGEFVNVGVVVHCAALRLFEVRLETAKTKRITNFFPELLRRELRHARTAVRAELERVRDAAQQAEDPRVGQALFRELVRPRETLFRFGEIRTILTDRPNELAQTLFEQYVDRQFAQAKEYHEAIMADRYYQALRQFHPERTFVRNERVGTEEYRVALPICAAERDEHGTPLTAIKPLDLLRAEPTAIVEHGDLWIQRVRRLKQVGRLPARLIFAVRTPEEGTIQRAAQRVLGDLQREEVELVPAADEQRVLALAAEWDRLRHGTGP